MRVGFDAKRAFNNPTGLGNHARILLNALARYYPENEYLLFTPKVAEEFSDALQGNFKLHLPHTSFQKLVHPLWRSWKMKEDILDESVNIFHGLSGEVPFGIHRPKYRRAFKTVVTIHDVIFLKHKEQFPWVDRQFFTLKTKYAARHSDMVIAVSQETKNDLVEMFGVPENRILVVYPAVDPSFQANESPPPQLSFKYLLNVGSFFPRKNQARLMEAYALIEPEIDEELWLVGAGGNLKAEIEALVKKKKLEHRVKILPDVKQSEMPGLYRGATALVYPSLFEGFGAPVLEALMSKTPVIASKGGAIEEAAGRNSVFFNPYSAEDIAEKIILVLKDENLRKRMVNEGYQHGLTMTDKVWAEKTMKIYESLR